MQTLEKSWETAVVDNINPLAALNQLLKTYRNTEHAVTKRKPAEWLFGRPIRTRIPDIKLQTQRDEEGSLKAKDMRNHGAKEEERHDRKARGGQGSTKPARMTNFQSRGFLGRGVPTPKCYAKYRWYYPGVVALKWWKGWYPSAFFLKKGRYPY